MRVLYVYKTYYPDTYDGVEQVIYQLSQGCIRRGITTDVFTFNPDKDTGPATYEDHRVIYNKQLFEITSTPFSLKALKHFRLIKNDYDIINYHLPFPFMDMLYPLARPDTRTMVTYHSDIVKQKQLMKLYQPLQERFLSGVDCIVASSSNYATSSQTPEKHLDKTVVIPFGLEQQGVQHDPQRVAYWREIVDGKFFLLVDTFRYYKGLYILTDAAERSRLLVMVVGDRPLESEVRHEVQQRGPSNVMFTGILDDENKFILFRLCRGVVLPPHLRSEVLGITLLEDVRSARPLISYEIGTGTSFTNQGKVSGRVIPPNDGQTLMETMNEFWNDEETSNRYGGNSHRRFEKIFTTDRVASVHVNLYTTLLGSKL